MARNEKSILPLFAAAASLLTLGCIAFLIWSSRNPPPTPVSIASNAQAPSPTPPVAAPANSDTPKSIREEIQQMPLRPPPAGIDLPAPITLGPPSKSNLPTPITIENPNSNIQNQLAPIGLDDACRSAPRDARALIQHILEALNTFAPHAPITDDRTLVALALH